MQRKRRGKKQKFGTSKERSGRRNVSAAVDRVIVEAEKVFDHCLKGDYSFEAEESKYYSIDEIEYIPCEGRRPKGKEIDPRNYPLRVAGITFFTRYYLIRWGDIYFILPQSNNLLLDSGQRLVPPQQ